MRARDLIFTFPLVRCLLGSLGLSGAPGPMSSTSWTHSYSKQSSIDNISASWIGNSLRFPLPINVFNLSPCVFCTYT